MGKFNMKKYIIISGFTINDNNRGTSALTYGAVSFLKDKNLLTGINEFLNIRPIKLRKIYLLLKGLKTTQEIQIDGIAYRRTEYRVPMLVYKLALRGLYLPGSRLKRLISQTELVAAINGGDGFSDIYGTKIFFSRLYETKIAMSCGKSLILLPQTIGPFVNKKNEILAHQILNYATQIYVRDSQFVDKLKLWNLKYTVTKDLSAFMQPEAWNIKIKEGSVGINISGLAYFNQFNSLAGHFYCYSALIESIVTYFLKQDKTIYIIPHSYNFHETEKNNDDLEASKSFLKNFQSSSNIILVNHDLTAPQIKYVISKMSFFIGTRMHSNFAALYSGVPVFGLAYSYKFKGGFDSNGLDGNQQTASIIDISKDDIPNIVHKIETVYQFYEKENKG